MIDFKVIGFLVVLIIFKSVGASASSSSFLNLDGRVVDRNGVPITASSSVRILIKSPAPQSCLLWGESQSASVVDGDFSILVGKPGNRLTGSLSGGATSFTNVFYNDEAMSLTGLVCEAGTSYTPGAGDSRQVEVEVNIGGETFVLPAFEISTVAYAIESKNSQMVGGWSAGYLLKTSPAGADRTFHTLSTLGFSKLFDLAESPTVDFGGAKVLKGLTAPVDAQDAATKSYVDSAVAAGGGGGGSGTVTQIGMIVPSFLSVSPNTVSSAGTFSISAVSQGAGTVLAGPSGMSGTPSFRSLVASDIPSLDASKITAGTLQVSNGGTGHGSFSPNSLLMTNVAGDAISGINCSAGQLLKAQVAGGWACDTVTINTSQIVNGTLSVGNGGTGLDTSLAANGQLLIGNGNGFSLSHLVGTNGISITNSPGTIVLSGPNTTGFWTQGGNSFAANGTLGTDDAFGMALKTAGTTRLSFDASGHAAFGTAPDANFTFKVSGNSSIGNSSNFFEVTDFGPSRVVGVTGDGELWIESEANNASAFISLNSRYNGATNYSWIQADWGGWLVYNSAAGTHVFQNASGSVLANISSIGVSASAFNVTSDGRLKRNIQPSVGLREILRLNGRRFEWKKTGMPDVGLIAQEVEKVIPELVVADPQTGIKSVKYANLVGPLVEGAKDLYSLSMTQAKRIDELEARLANLERLLAQ